MNNSRLMDYKYTERLGKLKLHNLDVYSSTNDLLYTEYPIFLHVSEYEVRSDLGVALAIPNLVMYQIYIL